MERVQFITHRGKRVLLIDHTSSTPEELQRTMDEVERTIAAEPPDSLLTLSDFTGTAFDKAAADHMKVVAAKDRPHVHRAALVGAESIPDVYLHNLESFSARHFPRFKTREEALDWLTSDESETAQHT
ncbi:MAG: STAS/SEC14 domain-containing protein [Terriglobales bacterium]